MLPSETNVEALLWLSPAAMGGIVVTAAVEPVFARVTPGDDLVESVAEMLASVEELLPFYLEDRPVDPAAEKKVTRFAMLGTSRARRILQRVTYSRLYGEQMDAVVALVGKLVDIAANLTQLSIQISEDDRRRIRNLAAGIAGIRADLLSRRVPSLIELGSESEASASFPLLREMEKIVSLIPGVFSGSRSISEYVPSPSDEERPPRLVCFGRAFEPRASQVRAERLPRCKPQLHHLQLHLLAAVEMKRGFISNIRLPAQLVREPFTGEKKLAIERSYTLRDAIGAHSDPAVATSTAYTVRDTNCAAEISSATSWFRITGGRSCGPAGVRQSVSQNAGWYGKPHRR